MKNVAIAMVILGASAAYGQSPGTGQYSVFTNPKPMYLTISCGNGTLSIATKDGNVTSTGDCNPDEAAMNFWAAVKRMVPKDCP